MNFKVKSRFLGLSAVTVLGSGAVLTAAPATAVVSTASGVVPFSAGHLAARYTGPTPPTTAQCLKLTGFRCYGAPQFQAAYNEAGLFKSGNDGTGQTIVIIDSFGSPTVKQDLAVYSKAYGLPPAKLTVQTPEGPINFNDPNAPGWMVETALDVEMAHATAPGAAIDLVEVPVAETEGIVGIPQMERAVKWAVDNDHPAVISQSWGATEQTFASAEQISDQRFAYKDAAAHGVTVLAASGDFGATDPFFSGACCYPGHVNSWPASDPLITSVGATLLTLDQQGHRIAPDRAWGGEGVGFQAGGGTVSAVFARPAYQNNVASIVGNWRGTPDISLSGDPQGQALVYLSAPQVGPAGWYGVAGTSEASPLFSGVVALAAQRAGHGLGQINPALYKMVSQANSGVIDVTLGNNNLTYCSANCGTPTEVDTTVIGYPAVSGYDMATGWGTVDAAVFVPTLARDAG
jgi:subtilase family serine protease